MKRIVGIDFDNTIASYDELFWTLARKHNLISPDFVGSKRELRDAIRRGPSGDLGWQKLQGEAYGPAMESAQLIPGVQEFFSACRKLDLRIVIVSHKSEYAAIDETRTPLREAARQWMRRHDFFSSTGLGMNESDVYFEATRSEKIARVANLNCQWFIDDLEEVFAEPSFPKTIERILFRPGSEPPRAPGVQICNSWVAIQKSVAEMESRFVAIDAISLKVFGSVPVGLQPIYAGRNSRVFRVKLPPNEEVVAKWYFRDAADPRNRMDTEYQALEKLWAVGIRTIPEPRAIAPEDSVAYYRFVDGHRPLSTNRFTSHLDQAADFIARLPRPTTVDAPASEATFSWNALLENLGRRRTRLREAANRDGVLTSELRNYLADWDLHYEKFVEIGARRIAQEGRSPDEVLSLESRILSPSDFGFHNAIEEVSGNLIFLDFEYFGVDDPVKTLSDFALHPAMGLSLAERNHFWNRLIPQLPEGERLKPRLYASYPIYGMKWCLILLNEFLACQLDRREFASQGGSDVALLRRKQLDKARSLLHKLTTDEQSI